MAPASLRLAVIGLGSMGRNHLRIYRQMEGVRVVAAADVDPSLLRQATHDSPTRAYDDYCRLLEQEELDAVSVAVPTRLHGEVALAAMARGVHLLVEKPIASTAAEGLAMERQAQAAGVKLMVGHVERFNPAVAVLRERLATGDVGRLLQIQARRVGPFEPRVRDVGVVHDLASHDLDLLRVLLGSEPLHLYALVQQGVRTQHEDSLLGLLRFPGDVMALVDVNWLSPWKKRQVTVLGDRGAFLLDYISQDLRLHRRDDAQTIAVAKQEPLRLELEAFVEAVRYDRPPPVSAADAIVALRLAEHLVTSGRSGRPLDVAIS
ncbi:MAG: Gfo/Idh/MocA family oxidoreductase [Dehalococcoidia bacterium]